MPYIREERRQELDLGSHPIEPGELNYKLARLCDDYLDHQHPLTYRAINDVMGVLAALSQELYRRIAVPYESRKLEANGDVFDVVKRL